MNTGRSALPDFIANVGRLGQPEAIETRVRFIREFIDPTDPQFKETVLQQPDFTNGPAYTGYLWDLIQARTSAPVTRNRVR